MGAANELYQSLETSKRQREERNNREFASLLTISSLKRALELPPLRDFRSGKVNIVFIFRTRDQGAQICFKERSSAQNPSGTPGDRPMTTGLDFFERP